MEDMSSHCSWFFKVTLIFKHKNYNLYACNTTSSLASFLQQLLFFSQSPQFCKPEEHLNIPLCTYFPTLAPRIIPALILQEQNMPQAHYSQSQNIETPAPWMSNTQDRVLEAATHSAPVFLKRQRIREA